MRDRDLGAVAAREQIGKLGQPIRVEDDRVILPVGEIISFMIVK